MSKIREASRILREEGVGELARKSFQFVMRNSYRKVIRPISPTIGYKSRGIAVNHGEIKVGMEEKLLDKFASGLTKRKPGAKMELGLCLGHIGLTQVNDSVVIIGGGNGISATTAALQTGEGGKVIIYDGLTGENNPRFGIKHIKKTGELNNVLNRFDTRHGFVGTDLQTIEYYQQHMEYDVPRIHPAELPQCDVLETDCNGLELDILKHMQIRPRILIIEVEAPFYKDVYNRGTHPRDTVTQIKEMGYTIVQRMGHEGKPLSKKQFFKLIDAQYETEEKQQLDSGAKDSPIILAVRNDYRDI